MKLRKELPILLITLIPFLYLAYIYPSLPTEVPIHWNAKGEIDGWGRKTNLWLIPALTVGLVYLIFLIIPKIDPKKQLQNMGSKFYQLKFVFMLFMSALSLFILYSTQQQGISNPNTLGLIIGLLFAAIGNYLPSVKSNYFIGIRTPWTLENEVVWKKTHRMAGRIWLIGGLLLIGLSLILPAITFIYVILGISLPLALIPLVYSYIIYKKVEKSS